MMNFDNIIRIAYLGPEASFPEIAKDYFCDKYNIKAYATPMPTVRQVMEYIKENPSTLGVVPVENSIIGTVRETLDNLMAEDNQNLHILSEVTIPIHYCLLSRTTEFYSITGIIANQQALGQCNDFIKNEMPRNLNIIEATNPSEAARSLQNYNLTYASIGSKKLAEVYNLNVLKESINDDKTNRTNYVLIGNVETEPTGHDKTTLMFTTEDRPGALMEILNIFYYNNVNLSYISSQISKDNDNKYIFVVSFDGHVKENNISSTISQVEDKAAYFKIIGSYEK
jgi:chorismate mutase/prephenate dehydratase